MKIDRYVVESSNNGWAIFYYDYWNKKIFIANQLSEKQASKWCDRLNFAYREGIASQY